MCLCVCLLVVYVVKLKALRVVMSGSIGVGERTTLTARTAIGA
jgi:hypothetical protein